MTDVTQLLRASLGDMGRGFGRVVATFHEVAGPKLAKVATPTALRNGTLTIRCTSASWAQTINLMELDLIERLNAVLEPDTITRIVARAGAASAPPPPPPPAPIAPLPSDAVARLEQLVAPIDDPELRARVLAAARATAALRAHRVNPRS